VRVEAGTAEAVLHYGRDFAVNVTIRNTSAEEQVLQTNLCDYGAWSWTSDNPRVQPLPQPQSVCEKNALAYLKLLPRETYRTILHARIAGSGGQDPPKSMTFRLGLQIQLGYGASAAPSPYVWSDPITVRIDE